jgi:ABC-type transport system involved in multi-copper enzyme maturation permease subunit/regulation of enolase protein 1 (concanavalin A-like superfamily)
MSELRGFPRLLRAEWTKFRTIRGWVIGMLVMVLATVLFGLLGPAGSSFECAGPDGQACTAAQTPPTGPEGGAVNDHFYFVHQPLAANGEITARVTSFTGAYSLDGDVKHPGTQPWSKAGIIIKDNTSPGSAYAAMMVTGANSVRMQFNYVHDIAGPPGANWLRLTRSGDTITGYSSADGTRWTMVGRTDLPGLAPAARAGLFATSPEHSEVSRTFAGTDERSGPSQATGVFDHVSLPGPWTGDAVGGHTPGAGFEQHGDQFTVTGSGDIAPMVASGGRSKTVSDSLVGVFAGLIAVIVVAAMFITGEYRRGLIRTTLAASPRRGRVLAAKAIVIGAVTFVAGLVSSTLAVLVVGAIENSKGMYVFPVPTSTTVRVVVGTAALLAVAAVLALAVGTLLRRSAGAVTAVIVAIVLPYILAMASILPAGVSDWLLRLTPAAGFAIQQSMPEYPQVNSRYTPDTGYFPLPPWGGFAVLCAYAAVALALAALMLRRRDA